MLDGVTVNSSRVTSPAAVAGSTARMSNDSVRRLIAFTLRSRRGGCAGSQRLATTNPTCGRPAIQVGPVAKTRTAPRRSCTGWAALWSPARTDTVSLRARHPPLYLAALAVGAVLAFALSASAQAWSATAAERDLHGGRQLLGRDRHGRPTTATIAAGGTVTFSSPLGNNPHNARFSSPGPSSCDPALPVDPSRHPGCHLPVRRPGSYAFISSLQHAGMGGTVSVVARGHARHPTRRQRAPARLARRRPAGRLAHAAGLVLRQGRAPAARHRPAWLGHDVRGPARAWPSTALVSNRLLATSRAQAGPQGVALGRCGSGWRQRAGRSFAVKLSRAARRALKPPRAPRRRRYASASRRRPEPATTKTAARSSSVPAPTRPAATPAPAASAPAGTGSPPASRTRPRLAPSPCARTPAAAARSRTRRGYGRAAA